MPDITDLRSTIIPKSDQLNADQLVGGPMLIVVTDVRVGSTADQPVSIFYAADPSRPYRPCLTMRKVLILAWGPDGTKWIGRTLELYNDRSVKWGGEEVGGIRISRMSDIEKAIKVSLTATKGRKAMHEIGLLKLSGELAAVLEAITAATNNDSMKKAKALAETTLTADADIALALAAYKKKVAELKAKAAAPAAATKPSFDDADDATDTPLVTYSVLADRLNKCKDADAAAVILDEGRGLPDDQRQDLQKVYDERFPLN